MKSVITRSATLAITLALTANLTLVGLAAQFTDVSGHWAQSAIENLTQRGILSGYPGGYFRPEGRISRAEFAAMLVRAQNLESQFIDNGSNFIDVPRTSWAYRPIEIVSDLGLVSGYPGGYFRPSQDISRAEAMAILVKAARLPLPNQAEATQILNRFNDAGQVPVWAMPAVAAAVQSGLFVNYPSTSLIEPNQSATRADVAAMVDKLDEAVASAQSGRPAGYYTGGTGQQQGGFTTGNAQQQGNVIHGQVSIVPAQTVFSGVATTAFSSDRNQVGDQVVLTLDRPLLSASGDIVIPQGSQIFGAITQVRSAGRAERNASVDIDFNRVVTPDGRTFPLSAEINTENGELRGGTTKGRLGRIAGRTVGGAAVGGAAGAILGAIKGGGKADDYLARGAVIGGAVGAGSSLLSRGNEVVVQQGDILELKLRQPLTITGQQ